MERTLILVKPDAFARSLTGEIITRFERKGLRLIAARVLKMTPELAAAHYAEHVGKSFYVKLTTFMTSAPLLAFVLEGPAAITAARQVIGATDPQVAESGTIRGDFGIESPRNLVHGSDGPEAAKREIDLFFPELRGVQANGREPVMRAAQLV